MKKELVVIGGGIGGYSSAIRAAQLGLRVRLVERAETLGGTCLNVGCIPSKALLESSERYAQAQTEFASHGLNFEGLRFNLDLMLARKRGIVEQLTTGIAGLLKKNRVHVVRGAAKFVGPRRLEVRGPEGTETIAADAFIVATGSAPVELPFLPFDGDSIVSSTEALAFQEVPRHLVVVGAGAIGLELGSVWRRLGAEVTVLEMQPQILPLADRQSARNLERALKSLGISLLTRARVRGVTRRGEDLALQYEDKRGESVTAHCDRVLVAVGRRPSSEGLGLELLGITPDEHGFIPVGDDLATTAPGVYAVGDVVAGPMLAHKAHEEGIAAAETIAGHKTSHPAARERHTLVPHIVYTAPELASVGYTEEALKSAGRDYRRGHFMFRANGRALCQGHTDGMVKVLAETQSDRLLGVHIVGPQASELIGAAVLGLSLKATSAQLGELIHAHPTLSEALKEAALDVNKRAIHA